MTQIPVGHCSGRIGPATQRAATIAALLGLLLAPGLAAAGDAAAGKGLFEINCSSCHGMTGKGDGPVAAALTPKPRDFSQGAFSFDTDGDGKKGTDADLKNVISNGAAAYGGSVMMAPWQAMMSESDIENVIAFVRTLKQ